MTKLWSNDEELFALARRELFTAVVGDVMDVAGLQQQFLPPRVQPITRDTVLIGRAMTVLETDYLPSESGASPISTMPFGLLLHALDDLKPGEIYISSGGSPRYSLWGGLMTIRAKKLGASGAILNGYLRDTHEILELGFPVFSYGSYAQDQGPRGKVIDYRVPLDMEGARIEPGDILFGDVDGVCVVPKAAEEEIFTNALEKARGEQEVRTAIEGGMSARDAFEKYGIL